MSHAEACLRDLLEGTSSGGTPLQLELAAIIARRAQRHNHLWQDLGLRSRAELSQLMTRHFAPLARRNRSDMKWKKFFSRLLCADGTVLVCTAPSCGECDDVDSCFGDERGETLLTA
jgi:nitrogen fixation protein NifQ